MIKNEIAQNLLQSFCSEWADWCSNENPDDLGGLTVPQAVAQLLQGQTVGCLQFNVFKRASGAFEIGFCENDPTSPFSAQSGVLATVDRGGRVWLRGDDIQSSLFADFC